MGRKKLFCIGTIITIILSIIQVWPAQAQASTYYVSSSTGDDSNTGNSESTPLASISKVNELDLNPGDQVLFKCGDEWTADPLILNSSGTEDSPIIYGSYPAGCTDQPSFSGSRSITGWINESGSIYYAVLSSTDFPYGVNQLFKDDERLTLGRWPNIDTENGGYATIDSQDGTNITDADLPAVDWSGAIMHVKNIRWSMLDRKVESSSSHTLTVNEDFSCLVSSWGSCSGWGFFLNNSKNTLDVDGEWYYDSSTRRVYLVSTDGIPSGIEGSVLLSDETSIKNGGIMLSGGDPTQYVTLKNLEVKNWFNYGISAPSSMRGSIYHDITLRGMTIRNVNGVGINLGTWIYYPTSGDAGFRGGYNMQVVDSVVDGANSFGITGYFAESTFTGNTIRNIGLVENLGATGMGCGYTASQCTENGDGFRILTYDAGNTGYGNTLKNNTFEKTAYNGVDVFGHDNTLEANYFTQSCYVKADCGAVRTFGSTSLSDTDVYNIQLIDNLVVDIPGNVDGCYSTLPAFGMGLYIDNYSRDVVTQGNFIADTTVTGILYQNSTGEITGNTIFNASSGTAYAGQVSASGSPTSVSMNGNTLFGLTTNAWTLYTANVDYVASSNQNRFYHPYTQKHITYNAYWPPHTLAEWQSASGQDGNSSTLWYSQDEGEDSLAVYFTNPSDQTIEIDLGSQAYLDLDQTDVIGSLTLSPFSGAILVKNGDAPLTIKSLSPVMAGANHAADFSLTVKGTAFTTDSIVRWNGEDQTTSYINSTTLIAEISTDDISSIGDYPIMVIDTNLGETETLSFHVFEDVDYLFLPLIK